MTKKSTNIQIVNEIKSLLLKGEVGTQDGLCKALEALGFEVNQSKISRLLRKIGAVKTTNDRGQVVYQLPKEPGPPSPDSCFSTYIISIESNEVGIVVRTVPGSAQLAGRLIDHNADRVKALGTVAGDDTVFVIPKLVAEIDETKAALYTLFGI